VIAKWVASVKDDGGGNALLFKIISELGRRAARIHYQEMILLAQEATQLGVSVRRGLSLVISFSGAVLVEAMMLQSSSLGTLTDSTVRCLIPILLSAVGPSEDSKTPGKNIKHHSERQWSLGAVCPDWRFFGQILASVLVDKCELDPNVVEILGLSMIRGLIDVEEKLGNHNLYTVESASAHASSVQTVETAANTLLILISLFDSYCNSGKKLWGSARVAKTSKTGRRAIEKSGEATIQCKNKSKYYCDNH